MAAREESTRMSPDVIDGTSNQALTLLAGVGIGAALMYFLDPGDGVVADHGKVILRGQASPDELNDVVTTVRRVRGVEQVENQPRVHAP